MEKLYFYALKKTGNKHDAEDLAQEIATQAVLSLSSGSIPQEFHYWIWAIARNCYAKWIRQKSRRFVLISSDEDMLTELSDGALSAEERLILKENAALLKRELSLLSSYFRDITVAYYIKEEKIPSIAEKMKLPAGTIKRRLYESRKNLREGMSMAREIGRRSFLAESISFIKSGRDGKGGTPWTFIQRLIPKNILLSAYRNPLTLEELCLEMGIAMPYMEEEVRLLTRGTLLKEVEKGRFETDFIIVDKDTQLDIFHKLVEISDHFCPLLLRFIDSNIDKIRKIDFIGNQIPAEELYWTLIPRFVDILSGKLREHKHVPIEYTDRPGNGKWDLTGYEECSLPFSTFIGRNGSGSEKEMMWTYKIRMGNLFDRAGELSSYEVSVLASVLLTNKTMNELSHSEEEVILKLIARGFLREEDKEIIPMFIVFTSHSQEGEIRQQMESSTDFKQLLNDMEEYYDFIYSKVGRNAPARLTDQLKFVTAQYLSDFRMMGLRYALEQNRIVIPEHINKSTIGMYMILQ